MSARRLPKLLLIDAMSVLFRAYHSIPARFATVDDQGNREPTNAVYGFLAQLLNVIAAYDPTHLAVAFDSPGPTFREEIDANYKANRQAPPDDLIPQFARARQLIAALGAPGYEIVGFEADDILGTLAQSAAKADFHVRIFSGDRDLFQLISGKINVFYPRPRGQPFQVYDRAAFMKRWGVEPRQLIDIKALQGDSSDNIPGVPGIGEKTAISLIRTYRTLDGVLAAFEDENLSPRARRALASPENRQSARISRRLATIDTQVPLEFDPDAARIWVNPDAEQLRNLLDRLGFHSIRQRLPFDLDMHADGQIPLFGSQASAPDWQVVDHLDQARALAATLTEGPPAALFGLIAGEGKSLRLRSLAICEETSSWFLPNPKDLLVGLSDWLQDPSQPKWAYAGKEMMRALAAEGIELQGLVLDAEIAAHLASGGESFASLQQLVARNLDQVLARSMPETDGVSKPGAIDPTQPVAVVRAGQAVARLGQKLSAAIADAELKPVFDCIEMPLVPVLARMEQHGVAMDPAVLSRLGDQYGSECDQIAQAIYAFAGGEFNLNSTRALGQVLYDRLGLPVLEKTRGGAPSTARRALERLDGQHPIIALMMEYRELSTLLRNYIGPLPGLVDGGGRLHPRFSQTSSVTGRVGTRNPNLQATPVRSKRGQHIRQAFGAAPGRILISADYSQIDLRVLAHISGDQNLIAAFANDLDVHTATAAQLFGVELDQVSSQMREQAKTVNFGIVYGITAHGLAWRSELDLQGSAALIDSYFSRYPGVHDYMEATRKSAHEHGLTRTLHGRIRRHHELQSAGSRRQAAEREAINMPIQGTSAEILKLAMIELDAHIRRHNIPAAITLQIHDELLIEVATDALEEFAGQLAQIMNGVCKLKVPLKTDIAAGPNWAQTKSLELS